MRPSFDIDPPKHLADKHYVYLIRFQSGDLLFVDTPERPTMKELVEVFIFQHLELTDISADQRLLTSDIVGIEKVPNSNTPNKRLTKQGQLYEIS